MNLKSATKLIKAFVDKKNANVDQRLVHVILNEDGHVQLKATSGSAILLIDTKCIPSDKDLGYLDVDSLCGMSDQFPEMNCMSFMKTGIKFSNSIDPSVKNGSIYYISKSALEGNFYDGLIRSNEITWKDVYEGGIDFKLIKKLSHSSKATDVFGHPRMCATFNNYMYTFRHSSMTRIPFHLKKEMYFDYRDISCIQHFLPEEMEIKTSGKSLMLSQDNVSLCILSRSLDKDYVSSFAKAFTGTKEYTVTVSRKDFKQGLIYIKKICKIADCKIKIKDTCIELEAIYDLGKAKKDVSSFSDTKIITPITCKTKIDLLLDFVRCGTSESININISKKSPFNRYLSMSDGEIEELIALRNDGMIA